MNHAILHPIPISSIFKYRPNKELVDCRFFVVHAISEWIERSAITWLDGFDKENQTFRGIPIDEFPEWIRYDYWLWLSRMSVQTFINPEAQIIECIDNFHVAYHAGVSKYMGISRLNYYSVGSEIVMQGKNTYSEFLKRMETEDWPSENQYKTLAKIIQRAIAERGIEKENVIGHCHCSGKDVRPDDPKHDPGLKFNWDKLHYYIRIIS